MPDNAAYFTFTYPPTPERFTIQLTDPAKIQHARNILNGTETREIHVGGRIIKRQVPYNRDWSFHLDPNSIDFFERAVEVSDAHIQQVEHHLDEAGGAFLPDLMWAPFGSRLEREVHFA
ncbi:calmodulin [Streptomyces sp. NPDC002328]|uniref:BP74-related protein n=1 Tax=Streptomyces sp. NPDC002328 TaxID=3364642 RepID=UPI0036A98AFD